MQTFYEVGTDHELHAFDTLEDAIKYADKNGATLICQNGGDWVDFEKCSFCGDWVESVELNSDGECTYCEQAIKSHGTK